MEFKDWIPFAAIGVATLFPMIHKWYINKKLKEKNPSNPFLVRGKFMNDTMRITENAISLGNIFINTNDITAAVMITQKDNPMGKDFMGFLRLITKETSYEIQLSPFLLEKLKFPFAIQRQEVQLLTVIHKIIFLIVIILLFVGIFIWNLINT